MRLTSEDLVRIKQQRGYGIASSTRPDSLPVCTVPDAKPERHEAPALERAAQGAKESVSRVIVRFVGYRVHPLDPDNFAGSVKDLLDGLRHAGIILGDEPWRIKLETEQEKVAHFADERTVIEILK